MKRDDWAVDRTGKERFFQDEELTMEIDASEITDEQMAEICGAVVLVRCKDCRYWQDNNGGYPHSVCKWRADETPDPDDFCSAGERCDG